MGTNITGIGNANAIGFKSRVTGGTYFPPELKDALVGVWSAYGKSNDSTDRNIIKNKIKDRGGDFVISNAAFKLNSGFGKYETELSNTRIWTQSKETTSSPFSSNYNGLSGWIVFANTELTNSVDMPSFKIQVKGLLEGQELIYRYYDSTGQTNVYSMTKDGKYTLPADVRTAKPLTSNTSGFQIVKNETNTITITQIPSFEGAFVTDGIDDLITSTKTVQEMGITDEVTVVSMIHQIDLNSTYTIATTNYIENSNSREHVRSDVYNYGKTGIYGYSASLINNTKSDIKNILGDEADYYVKSTNSLQTIFDAKFSVVGRISELTEASQVVWYWTIIANKVLTTDQINQVIAYFNLDKTLKPDILCNTIKQGITNENHAEFGDKLIDFSGNGRDIQLNNIAWKGDSGIGKYETDFTTWTRSHLTDEINFTPSKIEVTGILTTNSILINNKPTPIYNVEIHSPNKSIVVYYQYNDDTGVKRIALVDGINELPSANDSLFVTSDRLNSKGITITQIPSHAGALLLDGVDDFGKVTGMPIYKDYTFIIDRQIISIGETAGIVASKSESSTDTTKQGAFLFEYLGSPNYISSWSFYKDNGKVANTDFTRSISYQSKYNYNGVELSSGTSLDSDKLWLGIVRDNDSRFANIAVYSLMSFPYSMSEFLIERQLKMYNLGTLYPGMVEFRPIVKSNNKWDIIEIWQGNKSLYRPTVNDNKTGIYLAKDSTISIYVKPYVGQKVSKIVYNGVSYTDLKVNSNGFYYKVVPITKSPQKITMTIEQDENYVQWNPVVTSNVEYNKLDFYLNNYQKRINVGDYIPKDAYVRANFYLKNNVDELTVFTFNGVNIDYRRSVVDDTAFNIGAIYNYDSPQEVNITVDEYIRFEDIVQPYPVLLRFKDENGNKVSWGGKFKVGSTITRIGSTADSNLLPNIYNIFGLLLNGNQVTSSKVIVEKTMVFKAKSAYIFDNNEPKCILSPRLLRIPNSSYKILGYIPDISGNGNNGVFNNFEFAGMSGANGYPYDYNNSSFWADSSLAKVVSGELVEYFAVKNSTGFSNITSGVYKGKIKVTGVTKAISENKISRLRIYSNSTTDNELIDITQDGNYNIDIKGVDDANRVFFYAIPSNPNDTAVVRLTEPIYIEQVGNYEGSICFDGVDDYMDIPSLSIGGKQVLMKTNWLKSPTLLYDQRASGSFAILTTKEDDATNPRIAYQARNQDGKTYIDGIENNYIETYSLKGITHNITVTNPSAGSGVVPVIGANTGKSSSFAKMALYDFMLFDEVSTNEEIKQLNDIVGIEGGYVQKPPYYWDAYGKTNLDADKATIQQRGVAVGDYDLTNTNFAYDKMSGFGGYTLGKFTNSWSLSNNSNSISIVARNPYDITLKKLGGNSDWEFNNTELKVISNPVSVKFKSDKNIRFTCDYHYYTVGGNSEGAPLGITSKDLIANEDTIITISPISQENIDKYNIDINRGYYLIYFQLSPTLAVNEEVTIEMLPLYPNGLVYDGVDDYSENTSIPAFTDYTYIFKRTILNIPSNGATLLKGSHKTNGGAFIADYGNKWQFNFGQYNTIQSIPDGINWQTSSSFNGTSINRGTNTDDEGITVSRFSNGYTQMVFYKLMLYPRTTDMLTINMIKNMMAEDGIIDIQGKLFTDKFTGDFNLDFNKDFLIGN